MDKPHNFIIITLKLIIIIIIIIITKIIIIIAIIAIINIIVAASGPIMQHDGNGLFLFKKGNKHLKNGKTRRKHGKSETKIKFLYIL